MINLMISLGIILVGGAVGLAFGIYALKGRDVMGLEKKQKNAEEELFKSKNEADKIINEATAYVQKRKETIAHEVSKREARVEKQKEALATKEDFINKRIAKTEELKEKLKAIELETDELRNKTLNIDKEIIEKLSLKTGSGVGALKEDVLKKQESELLHENTERLAKLEGELKEKADRTAQKQIINIIQRLCSPTSVETRGINVKVEKDHMKGKIVGENAENITELEKLLDVDIVFNDLPNTISISAFNLVERRIAQKTLEKLVNARGNINKETIHRAVKDAGKETDDELYEIGLAALKKMGMKHDNKEFCRIVGRLKYRTSYGQNIMLHSIEVGWIAAMLGAELGLNVETCKVGGFLHDLGKAIDQDPNITDTHDVLSKKLMEKFGFSPEEVHAAWTHHDAIPQETAEAFIVKAADAISAGRPGARQESFEKYIQRIKSLEETAKSFDGVKRAFAISAGREVRVMVDPETINDDRLSGLAKELAIMIEENIVYPGKIKVNVIRRTKHTEIAK